MEARALATRLHGLYLVEAASRPPGAPLLVGFHGYGEAAEQHLEALRRLPGADACVLVAVQSLHLFYTKTRAVVGSWMTRVLREETIADNVLYAAGVVEAVRGEFAADGPLVFLGFSQGTSMAYRAAASSRDARGVIALCGDLPPELAQDPALRLPPVMIGHGRRDEWYTQAKLESDLAALAAHGVPARSLSFEGGHEWNPAFYAAADEFLRDVTRSRP